MTDENASATSAKPTFTRSTNTRFEEFRELKRKSARVCGFLASESLPQPRSRRTILIGAFFTAISPLMAQSGRVRIRVTDVTGGAIPRAQVNLLGADDKPLRTEHANEMGEIVWTDLPFGESKISVVSYGFATGRLVVNVSNSDEVKVNVQLQVGTMGGADFVEPDRSPLVAHLDPPAEITKPPRPKRHWWRIFH